MEKQMTKQTFQPFDAIDAAAESVMRTLSFNELFAICGGPETTVGPGSVPDDIIVDVPKPLL